MAVCLTPLAPSPLANPTLSWQTRTSGQHTTRHGRRASPSSGWAWAPSSVSATSTRAPTLPRTALLTPTPGQWLRFLEFSVPMRAGHAVQVTVKRVLLDQFVFAPVGVSCTVDSAADTRQLTLFVGSMGIMEGKSRAQIKQKFDDVYWSELDSVWC